MSCKLYEMVLQVSEINSRLMASTGCVSVVFVVDNSKSDDKPTSEVWNVMIRGVVKLFRLNRLKFLSYACLFKRSTVTEAFKKCEAAFNEISLLSLLPCCIVQCFLLMNLGKKYLMPLRDNPLFFALPITEVNCEMETGERTGQASAAKLSKVVKGVTLVCSQSESRIWVT